MQRTSLALFLLSFIFLTAASVASAETKDGAALWNSPSDIASRNLAYGRGGEQDSPQGPMVFAEEDKAGSNPKFYVRDRQGTKWTAKMGAEARPETAATHLLWAVGYYTDEDYFCPQVEDRRYTCPFAAWSEPHSC